MYLSTPELALSAITNVELCPFLVHYFWPTVYVLTRCFWRLRWTLVSGRSGRTDVFRTSGGCAASTSSCYGTLYRPSSVDAKPELFVINTKRHGGHHRHHRRELQPVMESSGTCPWPRWSLRTHFQVLGLGLVAHVLGFGLESQVLGLGLVKFSTTHGCTDTATKKVLMIRAKTVISLSLFPSWQYVTTLVVRFCHKPGVPARALWHDVPPQGKVAIVQTFGFMLYLLGLGLVSLALVVKSNWPWSWPRGLCPWPCHLCPWLHHCQYL